MNLQSSRGFTLAELLVAIVIASVIIFAFAMPFLAERIFWQQGKQQTEAQRDAQMVMHAISRVARECKDASISSLGTDSTQVNLTRSDGSHIIFSGGPQFNGGQFQGAGNILIDGNPMRSRVVAFNATYTKPILRLELQIDHGDRGGTESLSTEILLRNVVLT